MYYMYIYCLVAWLLPPPKAPTFHISTPLCCIYIKCT